ncbi:ATP-binding Cassette (ABC) Superfamily, partial [Thraustotheca clavata]
MESPTKTKETSVYVGVHTPKHKEIIDNDTTKPIDDDDDPDLKFSFMSLYRFAQPGDWVWMGIGLIMSIVAGVAFPFMAIIFGDALNSFAPYDQSAINTSAIDFLILAIVLLVTGYGSYAAFAIAAERQMKALRREVLKHIMYQEMGWYDKRDASELASRISGDTVKIKDGMGQKLGEALRFTFQFIGGYIIGFYKGWNVALAMCAVMPVMAISLTWLIKRLRESTERSQQVYASAGAVAEETIGAMRTIASLNGEPRAIKRYDEKVLNAEAENLALAKTVSLALGFFIMSMWFTYTIGLWYGGYLVSNQNGAVHSIGSVFSAFYGVLTGTMSLAQISPNISAVASAKGAAFALFKILARPSKIDAANLDGEVPESCEGHIQVNNLVFSYPTRPEEIVLRGYSLTIETGQTVALVGSSGSGKSTLVALLERFYEPTSGQILLDGRDITRLQLKWLRSQIGLVSQEPVLFATTILENIAAGGD